MNTKNSDPKIWLNPDDLPELAERGITIKEGANPEALNLDEVIIDPSKNTAAAALMGAIGMPQHDLILCPEEGDIPEWGNMRAYLNGKLIEGFSVENDRVSLQKWDFTIKIEFLDKDGKVVWSQDVSWNTDDITPKNYEYE